MEKRDQHTDTDTTDNNLSTARDDTTHRAEELASGLSAARKAAEKQEWAFTLYDLDGQGRVTKDEVAHLLKSLYDAVGSSISLPEAGTKSLKLLLTVSPDSTLTKQDDSTLERDLNCKECNSDKDKMHCHKKDINSKLNNDVFSSKGYKDYSMEKQPLKVNLQNNLSKAHRDSHVHGSANRMSVIEQRQLAELVQFNMEQNRKKKSRHSEGGGQTHRSAEKKRQTLHLSHVLENPDRRSYYLDLAGIDSPCKLASPCTQETTNTTEVTTQLKPKIRTKSRGSAHRRTFEKTKSQGYNLGLTKDLLGSPERLKVSEGDTKKVPMDQTHSLPTHNAVSPAQGTSAAVEVNWTPQGKTKTSQMPMAQHKRGGRSPHKYLCSKSTPKSTPKSKERTCLGIEGKESKDSETKTKEKEKPIVQFETAVDKTETPKHRRHKTQREKNHVRAMMQVAHWIEKEHIKADEELIIERHDHHHFHEHHHHHHYHHYHQTT